MELFDHSEAEKLHWLRESWGEGIESGDAGEIDFTELKQEARQRLAVVGWAKSPASADDMAR